ncbi:hypothetical protein [Amycolatopsis palatopharyngis]|nr:hypothetical protein [Amycolatopsis palatopharyngis]
MIRRFFRTVADVVVTIGVHLGIVRWPRERPRWPRSDHDRR